LLIYVKNDLNSWPRSGAARGKQVISTFATVHRKDKF
jgi:hypothetical protein